MEVWLQIIIIIPYITTGKFIFLASSHFMFHHLPGIFPASNRKQSSPTLAETLAQRQNLTTWMVLREVLVKGLDQWQHVTPISPISNISR